MQLPSAATTFAYEPVGIWTLLLQFLPSLTELYVLYEKLLLCESVVILAKSPQLVSEFISCLADLIRPVPYAGIYRPYMTMQSDFASLDHAAATGQSFLIGITNPFLLKRVQGNPHTVYLHSTDEGQKIPTHRPSQTRQPTGLDMPGRMASNPLPTRHLKSDKPFLEKVKTSLNAPASTTTNIDSVTRLHFSELTAQFLAPIVRYLTTSAPSDASSEKAYASFSVEQFLCSSLSKYGTSVHFQGHTSHQRHRARDAFYKSFCLSANFQSWLDMKRSLESESSAGLLGRQEVGQSQI